jgi:hypothetical protein
MGQPYPVLDYVKDLPVGVPALERPPSPYGYFTPIVPKSPKFHGPLPNGPAEVTYYFPIIQHHCNPTGVFFPASYSFPGAINIILYFHGFKQGKFTNINEYLSGRLMGIRLREDINATGKPWVLIAPTLGEQPGSKTTSDMRIFAQSAGGDIFLAEILRWIGKYVPEYTSRSLTPGIGKLILAGHSGAGVILTTQAWTMTTPISEVWGFDSLYGHEDQKVEQSRRGHIRGVVETGGTATSWLSLARMRQDIKFYFHWGTSPLSKSATELDQLAAGDLTNITVKETTAPPGVATDSNEHHFAVLTSNFGTRVQNAR